METLIKEITAQSIEEAVKILKNGGIIGMPTETVYGLAGAGTMPEAVKKAGKASYIERNQHMIDRSDLCVFYYDERYSPPKKQIRQNHFLSVSPSRSNSGTKLAYQYAMAHKKVILNLFPMPQN